MLPLTSNAFASHRARTIASLVAASSEEDVPIMSTAATCWGADHELRGFVRLNSRAASSRAWTCLAVARSAMFPRRRVRYRVL
jgi:hypothetical protein